MVTQTNKAVELYRSGDFNKAISIFKTFKLGFSREEREIIITAHEINTGNGNFYKSLGFDLDAVITKAKSIIENKYIN